MTTLKQAQRAIKLLEELAALQEASGNDLIKASYATGLHFAKRKLITRVALGEVRSDESDTAIA